MEYGIMSWPGRYSESEHPGPLTRSTDSEARPGYQNTPGVTPGGQEIRHHASESLEPGLYQ
jgi:hypothetical protein